MTLGTERATEMAFAFHQKNEVSVTLHHNVKELGQVTNRTRASLW